MKRPASYLADPISNRGVILHTALLWGGFLLERAVLLEPLSAIAKFLSHVCGNVLYRVQVVGDHFLVFHRDRVMLLQEGDQFEDARGIDQAPAQQRVIGPQIQRLPEEKVGYDKTVDFTFNVDRVHGSNLSVRWFMN